MLDLIKSDLRIRLGCKGGKMAVEKPRLHKKFNS